MIMITITTTITILLLLVSSLYICNSINNTTDIRTIISSRSNGLSIALHAQLEPTSNGKIVGSVLTTDGLSSALKQRYDIDYITIFYPFYYKELYNKQWDLIIIEGWFMMIHDFIQIVRDKFPNVIILYYCLDPIYPGLNNVITFNVDGYLTNSLILVDYLNQYAPTDYILLAADPIIMKANDTITKIWDTIYVGAGGIMLQYKPRLYNMLHIAKEYKLRLHGSDWDKVDSLKDYWQGPLPRSELGNAYASARIVLASTIESQTVYGMINNRIFEGLSSGSVVLSHYSDELYDLFGDVILLSKDDSDIPILINDILSNPIKQQELGQRSKDIIIQKHTWDHRAIQILDLFWHLKATNQPPPPSSSSSLSSLSSSSSSSNNQKKRHMNRAKLAWIVSDTVQYHLDYVIIIQPLLLQNLDHKYDITMIKQNQWIEMMTLYNNGDDKYISTFDVLMFVGTPCDDLLSTMMSYKHRTVEGIVTHTLLLLLILLLLLLLLLLLPPPSPLYYYHY